MVLGSVLQKGFADLHLPWPPLGGYCPLLSHGPGCGGPTDWAGHLVLPWFTFALLFLALYTRMIRVSVAETLHEDFVRTARAKGAGETRVLRLHVLPSASLRVLTMVGMEIGTAIGVCVYIETVYDVRGLGRLAVLAMGGATTSIDLPLTLGVVALITMIVVDREPDRRHPLRGARPAGRAGDGAEPGQEPRRRRDLAAGNVQPPFDVYYYERFFGEEHL